MPSRSRLIPIVLLVLFAAASIRLGIWQLDRLRQRRAANAAALALREEPEVRLPAPGGAARLAGRRVRALGTYDQGHTIVLRGRALRQVPGVAVVTPLRLEGLGAGDTAVLVERGFVPAPDAATIPPDTPPLDEPGEREVHGLALPIPSAPDSGRPITQGGRTTWQRLDLAALRRRLPYPILEVYLLQSPDSSLPALPRRLEPPPLDDGPHLSYAIQWFAFAAIALVFAGVFGRRGPGGGRPAGPADPTAPR